VHDQIVLHHRRLFYPSVFDSVDCQLNKLYITALCGDTSNDTDGNTFTLTLSITGLPGYVLVVLQYGIFLKVESWFEKYNYISKSYFYKGRYFQEYY